MGEALAAAFPVAREMFEEIDEALKQNLTRLMFQGPEDELVLTENAQPALMAVSLATVRVLVQEGGIDLAGTVAFVAGHSLGEYSALAAAGALRLDEAARLLKTRGRAMQEAVPVGEGAMAAVIGLTRWLATYWADKGIRVNALASGGVENSQSDTFKRRYSDRVPLGRMAQRHEVVAAALYLASDASSYVTGQTLFVDGGLTSAV